MIHFVSLRMLPLLVLLVGCGYDIEGIAPLADGGPDCVLGTGAQVITPDPSRCPTLDLALDVVSEVLAEEGYRVSDHLPSLTITVIDEPIGCGVGTLGCRRGGNIEISSWDVPITSWLYYDEDNCYELILSHEMIHWAMFVLGHDSDGDHENPELFGTPDSLSRLAWARVEETVCPLIPGRNP